MPPGSTAEEARAKRRVEREKFKTERAEAMAAAQAEAEAQFLVSKIAPELGEKPATSIVIPSNKNKTKPPSSPRSSSTLTTKLVPRPEDSSGPSLDVVASGQPLEPLSTIIEPLSESPGEPKPTESKEGENFEIQEMEHLQLTLPEAFFLAWALGCLRVLDPATVSIPPAPDTATISLSVPKFKRAQKIYPNLASPLRRTPTSPPQNYSPNASKLICRSAYPLQNRIGDLTIRF